MNKNKREHKIVRIIGLADACIIRLADIDIAEEARRTNHRKIPLENHRELSKLNPTLREAAMAFALSQDFKKFEPEAIGCTSEQKEKQKEVQRILDKKKYNLHIKEDIESFETSKKHVKIKTQA